MVLGIVIKSSMSYLHASSLFKLSKSPDDINSRWIGTSYLWRYHFAKSTDTVLENEDGSFWTTGSCLLAPVTKYKSLIILFILIVFLIRRRFQQSGIRAVILMCFSMNRNLFIPNHQKIEIQLAEKLSLNLKSLS